MALISINPATGQVLREYAEYTQDECNAILTGVSHAFDTWKSMSFGERGACFNRFAELLRKNIGDVAGMITSEMGKPIRDARAEVNKSAGACEYFAKNASDLLRSEPVATEAKSSYVVYHPLGVIFGIMPWNFPLWQVVRYAAPAMMAGNATVLKHANNVTGCALLIERLFAEAHFPPNTFRVLVVDIPAVQRVIEDPRIAGVTLTGSPRAGRAVAAAAGAALKKCVLELGGSDPFIVLDDADLDAAIEAGVTSRLLVSGQVCIAPKRFIVSEKLKPEFEEKLVARMQRAVMDDPTKEETTLGPLARRDLRETLARQVNSSVARGAKLLLGGTIPAGEGAYYPATVLTDVKPGMPAFDEELFGPVAAVIAVTDETEAVKLANATEYGLGAVVFSRDTARAERMALQIEAGCCFVNDFVRSDPRLPFGGVKHSGFGRELGALGIREFTNAKTVYIA